MRHTLPIAAVFSVIHTFALPLHADPRAEAEAAKAQIRFAEARLERAACDVTDARARYDDLARRHAGAIAELQRAVADRDAAAQCISSAEVELPNIEQALEAARRAADGYARSIPDAERRANETGAALDQLHAEAFAQFEALLAWLDAVAAVDAAQARYDQAVSATLEALVEDDAYIARLIDVMDAQDEVEALREAQPPQPEQLAAASKAWMEALFEVSAMEAEALAKDDRVVAAQAALRDATAARERVRRDFELALEDDPRIREAAQAHAAARESLEVAINGARAAEAEANRLQGELHRLQQDVVASRDRLRRFDQDLAQYEFTVHRFGRDLQDASLDIARATSHVEFAQQDRDRAVARLRSVIEAGTEEQARHARELERERRAREHAQRDRERAEAEHVNVRAELPANRRDTNDDDDARQASAREEARARREAEARRERERQQLDRERSRDDDESSRETKRQEEARRREEAARSAARREQADRDRREREAKENESGARYKRESPREDQADRKRDDPPKREEPKRENPPKREEKRDDPPKREENNDNDRGQRYKRR